MSPEEWKTGEAEERGQFRIFRVKEVQATSPRTGKELSFYLLECNDWVNVIAFTEGGKVVMIRQYRFGTQQVELEIPGGVIEEGETPEEAAVRELEEETGYNGGEISCLGSVSPNPAFHTNRCHTVVIQGVKPEGEQSLDPGEDLEVELKPLADIPGLIADGTVRHSLVMAAFQLLGLVADTSEEQT
mgnify:FL=1